MILFLLLIPSILFSAPHITGRFQEEKLLYQAKPIPSIGSPRILLLRVYFSDVKFTKDEAYFKELSDKMKKYYTQVSEGKLSLSSTMTPSLALSQPMGYYATNVQELKNEAIATATLQGISLNYDAIMILHSGYGSESDRYNQHPDWIQSRYLGGTYSIIPEMEAFGMSPLGVWCHEFGHQLGLDDMQDAGPWSLMDVGLYNGNGLYPSWPDPYSRIYLTWENPISTTTLTLTPSSNGVYYLGTLGVECFLVEKRNEAGIPGSGFLVWHYRGWMPNNIEYLSLLQADNNGVFDEGDVFPGPTRNFLLDDWTTPSLRYFDGKESGFRIEILIPHISKAKAFPNPVNLNETRRVFFETERGGLIEIYNIKGEHIKSLSDAQNIGRVYWDIDNLASGVYIFIVKNREGNRFYGKLGIIK